MPTLHVCVLAENAGVQVSQWWAETIEIWQDKGGLTTQWIDNKVREHVCEIAQCMRIINRQDAGPQQWDLLVDRWVTLISDLESKRALWTSTCHTRLASMIRDLRQHLTSLRKLAFAEGKINSKKPWLRRGNLYTLLCISLPQCYSSYFWWCVGIEDNDEETSGHRPSPIRVHWDTSTNFLVEPFRFIIAYVDPNIAGKRVGENHTQLFCRRWPGDDEMIPPIVISIIDTTILSIVNAAITGLQDPTRIICDLWSCWEDPNGDGGPYTCNVTPIFDHNAAARWVKAAMKFSNQKLFCVAYHGQQEDGTACAQTQMRSGPSYLPLNDILPPPANNMIDDIGEELDDNGETQRTNPRSFPTTETDFHMFERKVQKMIIRQQWYLEVIRNHALGLCANYKQSHVAYEDVALLREHDHIDNAPAVGSLANRMRTSSRPAAN